MDVYNFCCFATDDSIVIQIWDQNTEQIVFTGSFREAMYSDYESYDVDSFDLDDGQMILNIDTSY